MAQFAHRRLLGKRTGFAVFATALLLLTACGTSSTGGASPTATPAASPTPSSTATPAMTGYPIKVYFSKTPDSANNFTAVFPVNRFAPTAQVETYAVQLLIAGPTPEERAAGYYSELNSLLNGPSQCPAIGTASGPDFTLTLNTKGTIPEQGTATLKFCRTTLSPGEGTDARVLAELNATLLQFPSIKKAVILNIQGLCLFDLSTMNRCLQ